MKTRAWLQTQPNFLCWKLSPQPDGTVGKTPYDPRTGGKASSNDPTTWCSYEEAKQAVDAGLYDSIGIALTKELGLVIVDFDKVIEPGGLPPWVQRILADLDSYTEISCSGRGLHVLAWGSIPTNEKKQLEIYDHARMFAISTNVLGERGEIHDRGPQLAALHSKIQAGTVRLVVEKKLGLAELECGESPDGDESAGDFSYICLLIEQGLSDDQIDERFRASGRMREKWERDDYREDTITNCRTKVASQVKPALRRLRVVRFNDVQTREINWLWPGKLAHGHLTTLNGDPGTKKSFVSLDIAARISTGRPMPDGSPNPCPPSSVFVFTREDGLSDTVKPRFLAAGGDPRMLATVALEGSDETASLKLEDQLGELDQIMDADTKLIIFDPLIDFMSAQQNHESEVRDTLTKLKQFAERRKLCVIGINHLNKKSDLDAIHRTMGAKGFVGVARMNFLLGKDDGGNLHLSSLKNNLWADDGSLTFKLEDHTVEDGHVTVSKVGRVVWTGKSQVTADELTAPKGTKANRAPNWLRGFLQPTGTKKSSKEIYRAGDDEGFSEDQLKRALGKIGAKHEREGKVQSGTLWWLPVSEVGF